MAMKIGNIEFNNVRERNGKKGISYQYDISYIDENGVNQRKFFTFKNKEGLTGKELARALQTEIDTKTESLNEGIKTGRIPKFADLVNEYLQIISKSNNQPSTHKTIAKYAKRVCNEMLANIQTDKINARNVQTYLVSLTQDGANKTTGGGLTTASLNHIRWIIIAVMNYAVTCGIIKSHDLRNATTAPKQKGTIKKPSPNHNIFTEEETFFFKSVLDNPSNTIPLQWRCYFTILLATGARKGEVLALRFTDFNGNRVHFDRSVNEDENRVTYINPEMKTANSHRYNTLPYSVIDLVNQLKAEQKAKRQELGELYHNPDNHLFTQDDGNLWYIYKPNQMLDRITAKFPDKLHRVTVHSFRHLFVSSLVDKGYTVPRVAKIIGDTPEMVSKTYMHFFERAEKDDTAPADCLPIFSNNGENVANPVSKIILMKNQKPKTRMKSVVSGS